MTQVSTSFVQDQKHVSKSDRFVAIKPSQIAEVLDGHGFDLVHLKTGRARKLENQDHQTTVARYRSRENFDIEGQSFDLIFKVPHLTGALQAVLGLFRGICANQLNVGAQFQNIKVRHVGDALQNLDQLIPQLVAQRSELVDLVRQMQARNVTPKELVELARSVAVARLGGVENISRVESGDLIRPRRSDDNASDLFTVINVLQENAIRFGLRYQTVSTDQDGRTNVRNMITRRVNEQSVKAISLNGSIWDIAQNLLAA